jgi:murein DD-endopeptidase MepM/ murein hydrolase activator NlpD
LFAACLSLPLFAAKDPVTLEEVKTRDGYDLFAVNTSPWMPYHATLNFDDLTNLSCGAALPVKLVIAPASRLKACALTWVNRKEGYSYRSNFTYDSGDPNAVPDQTAYLLPYAHGVKHQVVQGYFGRFTHSACRCLDFDLEMGEAIHAARGGVVVRVKQDSSAGGEDPSFAPFANVVEVLHFDGTWAGYAHLQKNGARVKEGQPVKAGDVLGLCGATGQVRGPHLHFAVYRATWAGAETVPTQFKGKDGGRLSLEEGKYYYARHPGGKPFKEVMAEQVSEQDLEKRVKPVKEVKGVKIRGEKLDNKVFIFCQNGTAKDQEVSVNFRRMQNMQASKPLPVKRVIKAGQEAYIVTLETTGAGDSGYQVEYSFSPTSP